jgi:hypothetical protein
VNFKNEVIKMNKDAFVQQEYLLKGSIDSSRKRPPRFRQTTNTIMKFRIQWIRNPSVKPK